MVSSDWLIFIAAAGVRVASSEANFGREAIPIECGASKSSQSNRAKVSASNSLNELKIENMSLKSLKGLFYLYYKAL